jgi:nitroreductase
MIPFEKNRSYRRFYQECEIPEEELLRMIDAARLSPSSRNVQPIKYFISADRKLNERIFGTLAWAGYLKDWDGPAEGERPSAYIIQLHDKDISAGYSCDHGITAQSILLQAVDAGFGGCIIASVKREQLAGILELPEKFDIIQVLALGKPKETVVIEDMKDNDCKYWRDAESVHHVPKRSVKEMVWSYKKEA